MSHHAGCTVDQLSTEMLTAARCGTSSESDSITGIAGRHGHSAEPPHIDTAASTRESKTSMDTREHLHCDGRSRLRRAARHTAAHTARDVADDGGGEERRQPTHGTQGHGLVLCLQLRHDGDEELLHVLCTAEPNTADVTSEAAEAQHTTAARCGTTMGAIATALCRRTRYVTPRHSSRCQTCCLNPENRGKVSHRTRSALSGENTASEPPHSVDITS